jgi:predicted nucleic acid-binding protein
MTVVIADTSPLNYLLLIGEIDVLPKLYGTVTIPREVFGELADPSAPKAVLKWVSDPPDWLKIHGHPEIQTDELLAKLDPGERAAILLAQMEVNALLLIDDAAGRAEAQQRGIRCVGTIGILQGAASGQFLDLPDALARLSNTNFRISQKLIDAVLTNASDHTHG